MIIKVSKSSDGSAWGINRPGTPVTPSRHLVWCVSYQPLLSFIGLTAPNWVRRLSSQYMQANKTLTIKLSEQLIRLYTISSKHPPTASAICYLSVSFIALIPSQIVTRAATNSYYTQQLGLCGAYNDYVK